MGLCSGIFPRYYFNSKTGICEHFIYSGCGGNDNRFSMKQECEQECGVKDPCTLPLKTVTACWKFHASYYFNPKTGHCQLFRYWVCGKFTVDFVCEKACVKKDICTLPPDMGHCTQTFPSYFFNLATNQCEEFTYRGCGGNDNRFSTMQECKQACDKKVTIIEGI